MILRSNGTKEPESAEDYLLLEIERLKQENERLKMEVETEKENKIFRFVIAFGSKKETEYKIKLNGEKTIKIRKKVLKEMIK